MTIEKQHVTSVAAILVGAFLFYLLGSALLAHAAHADAVAAPPDAVGAGWAFWIALAAAFGTAASLFLHWLAPRTKSTIDDTIRDDLDKALAMIQELKGITSPPAPIIVRVPPGPPSNGGGTAAMLAVLLLGGALSMQACAGTGAVVKREASYLEGCSVADAATIITASKAITDDAKVIKAGGDRTAAAIDVIAQLALIHAAYAHCKATAEQPVASVP